ncbi:MAG: VWA domain-containing protein [Chitinophagales bacterium]|nr:VWA domain-containing protein [Chitinophagales bacterium]
MQWILTYPAWTLVLGALLATLLTFWLYKGADKKFEISKAWVLLLACLRWSAIFLMILLLLNPLLRSISNNKIDAEIIFLEDNSASIREGLGAQRLKGYQEKVNSFIAELSKTHQVKKYAFGLEAVDSLPDSNQYHLQGTDIDKALEQVAQQNINRNIGAVIVSSDGLYNQGLNPIYNTSWSGIPIYTITVGDTTTYKDIRIQRLKYSEVVYLGDEAQLLVDINADNLSGQSVDVQLKNADGKILQSINTQISSNDWYKTLEFKILAEQPGIHKYQISISKLSQEKTFSNNIQEFYLQVIDGRQKIVIVYDAPHPDIKLIREALVELKNMDIDVLQVNDFVNRKNTSIDLLILYGLPSVKNPSVTSQLQSAIQNIQSKWWVISSQTDLSAMNKLQNVAQFSQIQQKPNEVTPIFLPTYQNFFVSDNTLQWLDNVPPLLAPYGQYQVSNTTEICWTQKMSNVKLALPLLATQSLEGKKTGILFGEGLWRWRMQEYLASQTANKTYEWVQRLVQYLASAKDHRQFKIKSDKTIYNESERIALEATLYNESGQLVNVADVKVVLNKDGSAYSDFFMDKTQNAFTYNLGKLSEGAYHLSATTQLNGKKINSEYKFAVQHSNIETYQTKADIELMNSLALHHYGKMVFWTDMEQLLKEIQNDERIRPVFKENISTQPLIHFKMILGIIILLLAIEWFLRRFFGQL